jgi:hypothetical protein
MEIRWMRVFLAVAEELNFGSAARSLHIAQPAVSQQVAQLEKSLGVTLFDRTTRSVKLISAGRDRTTARVGHRLAARPRVPRTANGSPGGRKCAPDTGGTLIDKRCLSSMMDI